MAEEFDSLLQKARDGSKEALGRLMEKARLVLLKDANAELASALRAKEGASDLVQDTFLEAQRHLASFRGRTEREWVAWLRRTLEHNLVDAARHYQNTAKRQIGREVHLHGGDVPANGTNDLPTDGLTPSRVLSQNEEVEALQKAVDRLPADYRDVVLWHHRDRLTNEQIGQRMGRSAEAVRKLWVRALEMLADELQIDESQP